MGDSGWPILGVAFVVFVIGAWGWYARRSDDLLHAWADANGYTILSRERRFFGRGPFSWTTSEGQAVYFATLRDREGHTRRAYVRCGRFVTGLLSDHVEVRWAD